MENSGEGKTYHKSPPQKRFWTPPLMIRFPPPLCSRNVILLRGNGHRPEKIPLSEASKTGFGGGALWYVPPPPLNRIVMSEKLQNESVPNFSNFRPEFCPEFCSEFSPNFSRTFRASFRGRRRPEKIHQKSPPFFNAKFPGKHEKTIHKILLESRQSNKSHDAFCPPLCEFPINFLNLWML